MIIITLNNISATFNKGIWICKDRNTEQILGSSFDETKLLVSDTYKMSEYFDGIQGIDSVALDAISNLKPKVIEYIPDDLPIEEPGVYV